MTRTTSVLLALAIAILYKAASNLIKMLRCKTLQKQYTAWIESGKSTAIFRNRGELAALFKGAGIKNTSYTEYEPVGNALATCEYKLYDNLLSKKLFFSVNVSEAFEESIGTYRYRLIEAINPLYWIELVVLLPKHIIEYIGINVDKKATKLVEVLLTIIWWLLAFILFAFDTEVYQIVIKFSEQF